MWRSRPRGIVMLAMWGSISLALMFTNPPTSKAPKPPSQLGATSEPKTGPDTSTTSTEPNVFSGADAVALLLALVAALASVGFNNQFTAVNARIDAVSQQLVDVKTDVKDVKMEVMSANEKIEKRTDALTAKIEKRTDALTAKGEFSSYLAVGGAVFTDLAHLSNAFAKLDVPGGLLNKRRPAQELMTKMAKYAQQRLPELDVQHIATISFAYAQALFGVDAMKRPAAAKRKLREIAHFDATCSLDELDFQARRIGFDANAFLEKGYAVLKPLWSPEEWVSLPGTFVVMVLELWNNKFVCLRPNIRNQRAEKLMLFSLINREYPLLKVQVAVKQPNFEGYADLQGMTSPNIGHVDQTISRQKRFADNSHVERLQSLGYSGLHSPQDIAAKYLGDEAPAMVPVRASPGQAIIMHHQTIHGVGPNHADQARVNVYFRVTASVGIWKLREVQHQLLRKSTDSVVPKEPRVAASPSASSETEAQGTLNLLGLTGSQPALPSDAGDLNAGNAPPLLSAVAKYLNEAGGMQKFSTQELVNLLSAWEAVNPSEAMGKCGGGGCREAGGKVQLDGAWSFKAQLNALGSVNQEEDFSFRQNSVKEVTDRGRAEGISRLQKVLQESAPALPTTSKKRKATERSLKLGFSCSFDLQRIALKKDGHGGFQLVGNAILVDPVPQNVAYLKEAIQKKKKPNRVTCDADEISMYSQKEDEDWVPEDEETEVNRGKSKAALPAGNEDDQKIAKAMDAAEAELRKNVLALLTPLRDLEQVAGQPESDTAVLAIFRQLRRLNITTDCLKATRVALELNKPCWRGSKAAAPVRDAATSLIKSWRNMYRAEHGQSSESEEAARARQLRLLAVDLEDKVFNQCHKMDHYCRAIESLSQDLGSQDLCQSLVQDGAAAAIRGGFTGPRSGLGESRGATAAAGCTEAGTARFEQLGSAALDAVVRARALALLLQFPSRDVFALMADAISKKKRKVSPKQAIYLMQSFAQVQCGDLGLTATLAPLLRQALEDPGEAIVDNCDFGRLSSLDVAQLLRALSRLPLLKAPQAAETLAWHVLEEQQGDRPGSGISDSLFHALLALLSQELASGNRLSGLSASELMTAASALSKAAQGWWAVDPGTECSDPVLFLDRWLPGALLPARQRHCSKKRRRKLDASCLKAHKCLAVGGNELQSLLHALLVVLNACARHALQVPVAVPTAPWESRNSGPAPAGGGACKTEALKPMAWTTLALQKTRD
ncbi:hypothetical protein AK812_SmicGene5847 [Symbiodinium microadriaticum]|uniref:TFIIS N-terminal domain-containing protein n=1 Tax=Symbiodinium microadriaticum TaxID=2951 RepID=A0A1Q9ESR2_SYMMI|nr:hypothetical protein AK812_SmicGene5847 [Symbiodinium microadriaticum]